MTLPRLTPFMHAAIHAMARGPLRLTERGWTNRHTTLFFNSHTLAFLRQREIAEFTGETYELSDAARRELMIGEMV